MHKYPLPPGFVPTLSENVSTPENYFVFLGEICMALKNSSFDGSRKEVGSSTIVVVVVAAVSVVYRGF